MISGLSVKFFELKSTISWAAPGAKIVEAIFLAEAVSHDWNHKVPNTYAISAIRLMTATWPILTDLDQFSGFAGSLGPSHSTTFGSAEVWARRHWMVLRPQNSIPSRSWIFGYVDGCHLCRRNVLTRRVHLTLCLQHVYHNECLSSIFLVIKRTTLKMKNNRGFIFNYDDLLLVKLHFYRQLSDWIIALNCFVSLIALLIVSNLSILFRPHVKQIYSILSVHFRPSLSQSTEAIVLFVKRQVSSYGHTDIITEIIQHHTNARIQQISLIRHPLYRM